MINLSRVFRLRSNPRLCLLFAFLLVLAGCSHRELLPEKVSSITVENDPVILHPIAFGTWANFKIKLHNPNQDPVVLKNLAVPTTYAGLGHGCGNSSGATNSITLKPQETFEIACRFYVGPSKDNVDPERYIAIRFFCPYGHEDVACYRTDGDILFGAELSFEAENGETFRRWLFRYHIDAEAKNARPYFILGLAQTGK